MNEQEKEKGLRDAATRAAAVLRSVAQDQANEQSRRKVLLHTLLDAVLCAGEIAPTLTVLGGTAYLTAERVDLKHELSLAGAAHRRIAGHIPDGVERDGIECDCASELRGGQSSLDPGVSRADNDDIYRKRLINHKKTVEKLKFM